MGLDVNGTRFIIYARERGVDLSRTAMIGRQGLHLRPADLATVLKKSGVTIDKQTISRIFEADGGYAEELFRSLGANEVHSFDHSEYEGATHIHDMNQPIAAEHTQQYSMVLDGGSLEHIFNLPVAMKNCMEMVRVGGHYLGITPANNFLGHGFYQFSPELYFSIFTPANGYEIVDLLAFEDRPHSRWYTVKSPAEVRGRVTLINSAPVYLLVIARRIEAVEPFRISPQQSDYVAIWNDEHGAPSTTKPAWRDRLREAVRRYAPLSVKHCARKLLQPTGFTRKFFQPANPISSSSSPNLLRRAG